MTDGVDVIVASALAATLAARHATSTIPIVMVHAGNPVGAGLIATLAHPGGNVTGTANLSLAAKQVQLLREVAPGVTKIAVLANPTNDWGVRAGRHQRHVTKEWKRGPAAGGET